jgi:hypothetical protein
VFYRHSFDKLIYPMLGFIVLIAICYRPKYRLQDDMPKAFFFDGTDNRSKAQKTSVEKRIASSYWQSARMNIQWKYPHGSTLPGDPPPEFRIEVSALGLAASDPMLRALYWRRLQQVWPLPEAWKQEYEFSFDWASDPISSASQWLRDHADRWFSVR